MKYFDLLKNQSFTGLKDYNLAEYFRLQDAYLVYGVDFAKDNTIKKYISHLLIHHWTLHPKINKNGKIIFLYSYGTERKDYFNITDQVSKCVESCSRIIIKKTKSINIIQTIKLFILSIIWAIKIFKYPIALKNKFDILAQICEIYRFKTGIESINLNQYQYAVVYCDISSMEQIFIQYVRKYKNIKLITLQHGLFQPASNHPKVFEETGYALIYSKADFFLAWNNITKNRLIKVGREANTIKVLGLPQYANISKIALLNKVKNKFGVLLGVDSLYEDNRQIIEASNNLAKTIGIKYEVKLHPLSDINLYKDLVDKDKCIQIYSNSQKSILDFASDIDFAVISGNSSIFIELTFIKMLCFCHKGSCNYYPEIETNRFTNSESLLSAYTDPNKFKYMDIISKEICGPQNPNLEYKSFFNSL